MNAPVIGFIGVGLMGHGMAKNILEGGYELVITAHRNRERVDDLISRGAREVPDLAELSAASDVIFICVSGSPQVDEVVLGPGGVANHARENTIVVDCSTSDPVSTLNVASKLTVKGIHLADAPLGRTPKEAWAGELDMMVGASTAIFGEIEPLLKLCAGNIVHLGPVGMGHKMKLINNFISLGYGALYAEALALARKSGLNTGQFHAVIGSSRMANGFYDTFMKYALDRDENAHKFAVTNAHKDMRYLSNLAVETGAVNPIQSAVRNTYAAMDMAGQGDKYLPMVADFVAEANGLPSRDPE